MASAPKCMLLHGEKGKASDSETNVPNNEQAEDSKSQIKVPSKEQEEVFDTLRLALSKRQKVSSECQALVPYKEREDASKSPITAPNKNVELASELLSTVSNKSQEKEDPEFLTTIPYPEQEEVPDFFSTVPNQEQEGTVINQKTTPCHEQQMPSKPSTTLPNNGRTEDSELITLIPDKLQEQSLEFSTTIPYKEQHEPSASPATVPYKDQDQTTKPQSAVLHKVEEVDSESQTTVPYKEDQKASKSQTALQDKESIEDSNYQTTDPLLEQENILEPITSVLNKEQERLSELFMTVLNKQQEEVSEFLTTTPNNGLEEASTSQTMVLYQSGEGVSETLTMSPCTERHKGSELSTMVPCEEQEKPLEPLPMILHKVQNETSEALKTAPNKDLGDALNSLPMILDEEKPPESQINISYKEYYYEEPSEFRTTVPNKQQIYASEAPTAAQNKEPCEALENIKMVAYLEQEERLRAFKGRQLVAQHDDDCVVLYQTFSPEIADYAVKNGYFGGSEFYTNRTTWLKLSFLWTMEKSQWATLPGRERVLAIKVDKNAFLEILDSAASTGTVYQTPPGLIESEAVTLRWTVDYGIDGEPLDRLTPLIGLRSYMLKNLNSKYIDTIQDITDFVRQQHTLVRNKEYDIVHVPLQKQFVPERKELCMTILLKDFYVQPEPTALQRINEIESLRKRKSSSDVVLFLQGAFNPVHTKHVQIIVECRKWLEKNTQYKVVAAFMGVNSNELVTDKIKKKEKSDGLVVKLHHRIKMCEISVLPYNWIHIYNMGSEKSFNKNISATMKQLKLRCKHYFYIFGADRGIKMCHSGIRRVLFVGREGSTDKLKQVYFNTVKKRHLSTSDVHFIPVEMENVNSTEIRESLKRMSCMDSVDKKREEIYQLTDKGWLDKFVADYLIDFEHDLYENIYTKQEKCLARD